MKINTRLRNEDGTVLVVALLILVFLTLIGITITATTEVEIQIAGNERLYKENLYNAEGASMECAQRMEHRCKKTVARHARRAAVGTHRLVQSCQILLHSRTHIRKIGIHRPIPTHPVQRKQRVQIRGICAH